MTKLPKYKEVVLQYDRQDNNLKVLLDTKETTTRIVLIENDSIRKFQTLTGADLQSVAEKLNIKLDLLRAAVNHTWNTHQACAVKVNA